MDKKPHKYSSYMVRKFGRELKAGDVVVNRFREHGWAPMERELRIVKDVRRLAFFILDDIRTGETTWMRTRTIMQRYALHPGMRRTSFWDTSKPVNSTHEAYRTGPSGAYVSYACWCMAKDNHPIGEEVMPPKPPLITGEN